jgi:hypothetical protein
LHNGDPIPATDHVLRYVGGTHFDEGQINGSAFLCRSTETSPSANWLECFGGALLERIDQVRQRARIKYGATARLARINVGRAIAYVRENDANSLTFEIVLDELNADPLLGFSEDPSHSLMNGIPKIGTPRAELIGDLLARCVIDSFPARPSRGSSLTK